MEKGHVEGVLATCGSTISGQEGEHEASEHASNSQRTQRRTGAASAPAVQLAHSAMACPERCGHTPRRSERPPRLTSRSVRPFTETRPQEPGSAGSRTV